MHAITVYGVRSSVRCHEYQDFVPMRKHTELTIAVGKFGCWEGGSAFRNVLCSIFRRAGVRCSRDAGDEIGERIRTFEL
jgi:hypothetical protein